MTKPITVQPGQSKPERLQPDSIKAGTVKPAAAHKKRSTHNTTLLQISLVAGTVLATLLGTNLLASTDANAANANATDTAVTDLLSAASPATINSALILAPIPTVYVRGLTNNTTSATGTTSHGATAAIADTTIQLNLAPITAVAVPNLSAVVKESSINLTDLLSVELPAIPSIEQSVQQSIQRSAPVSRSRSSR